MIHNILSIAGSDPSGGAGIQADIKTISANGGYAMAVITAVTAQSTTGVTAVRTIDPDMVAEQIDAVCADVRVDAVKIGLLPDVATVEAVTRSLERWRLPYVVVDPVLVAQSGDDLANPEVTAALRTLIFPVADLITPNLSEAGALAGKPPATDVDQMTSQAKEVLAAGAQRVLLKGGHLGGSLAVDVLAEPGKKPERLAVPRVDTANGHGTGCTLSSAIAARRPGCATWHEAVAGAKEYLTGALQASDQLDVGRGPGPVHHFWRSVTSSSPRSS